MKHFVYKAANPPRWCALSPDQWREQWRNALTADDLTEGRPGLSWVEHTWWGQLRWRAATYYDALALAEGSAGATVVEQVVVYDPSRGQPLTSEPTTRLRWWRWRRHSSRLTHPAGGVMLRCCGTKDVLDGLIAPANELDTYLSLLDSADLSYKTSTLAHRLLWEGVLLADRVNSICEARRALTDIQDRLHQLSLAAWQAHESLTGKRAQSAIKRAQSTTADLQASVDAALRDLREIADRAPYANNSEGDHAVHKNWRLPHGFNWN
ncbi:hypothetical protein [Flindersiella endophytica]